MPETTDEILVGMARAGESASREELFRRHFAVAHRVAFRLLGNDQDALDAVQDGFLKALLHLGDFDGRSGFRTWLLRIVTNAALDLNRRRRRRPAIPLDDGPDGAGGVEVSVIDDPAAGLHRQDLRRALDAALDRLSPSTRATFVLFAEAGLTYQQIADCQDVPIGTVMSRLYYARQKLQSFLSGVSESVR